MMKRIAWTITIIAILVGGGYATFRDPGRIHIYSANGKVLAETELEGFCSGATFWETKRRGNQDVAARCRVAMEGHLSTVIDYRVVQEASCRGAKSKGYEGDLKTECLEVLQMLKFWPTMDGQLSGVWSDAYPYPFDQFMITGDDTEEDREHTRPGYNREE